MHQGFKSRSPCQPLTFLFDIGRVLLDFDFETSLKHLLPENIHNSTERLRRILARKDAFETGSISAEEYTAWSLGILGSNVTASQFHQAWRQIFTVNAPMWRCIEKLSNNGHRLILISNTNTIHCPWIFNAYPVFSHFESAVLSFEIGYIKPQPEIYRHAITKHQLNPVSTIYIDDLPENITTGASFGFRCWQYDINAHHVFEDWLEKNLN